MIKPSDLTAGCTVRLADGTTAGPLMPCPGLDDIKNGYIWLAHTPARGRMTWTAEGTFFTDYGRSALDIAEVISPPAQQPTDP